MSLFRIRALPYEPFAPLFALDDATLAARGMARLRATKDFGFPCRVSLRDAQVGEELILCPFEHQPAASPYRASGPIYIRRDATRAEPPAGELPEYVTRRVISLRAYGDGDLMIAAEVCDGPRVKDELERILADPAVRYVHLHNAKPGCFSCAVDRAQ